MSIKRLSVLVLLILLVSAVLAPVSAQEGGTIKVYTSWPLTGGTQFVGQSMLNAANLALEHYLEDHDGVGPGGFTIEIVALDDASPTTGAWDGTIEAENAQRCVNDAECMVYFGTYNSGAAKVSMVITNEAGVAQVSPANTAAGLTTACATCEEGEPEIYRPTGEVNYFRVSGNDDNQGAAGASWAYCLGYDSVYILDDTQAYGKGIADVFEAQAEAIGIEVVGHSSVESTDIDFRALLTDVLASGAEAVYGGFVLDSGGPQVIQQMNEVGLFEEGIAFIGPDGLASVDLFNQIGGVEIANDNVFITFPAPQPSEVGSEKGLRLYEDYVAAYEEEPDPYAIYAYDGMMVILDAIERAGVADRAAILEAIAGTTEFEGVLGTFGFNEDGDNSRAAFYGYAVTGDAFANGTLITADMNESCERAE